MLQSELSDAQFLGTVEFRRIQASGSRAVIGLPELLMVLDIQLGRFNKLTFSGSDDAQTKNNKNGKNLNKLHDF